jgi:hypothetical protein
MNALSHHLRASRILLSASLICALSIPALAGDGTGKSDGAAPPSATAAKSNSAQPKPDREKKIYTNEDVEALARSYGASTVGNSAANNSLAPASPRPATRQILVTRTARAPQLSPDQDPARYAQQYVSLSAKMDDIDNRVQELRNFRASDVAPGSQEPGITVGLNIYAPCPAMTTDAQIQLLLQQRAELEAQISDLEDRARINGIDPAVLRSAPGLEQFAENRSTRDTLIGLQSDLAEVRDTEAAMHQEAAAQNMTLIPETRFGGGFTADYLKQLNIQQATVQQQISAVEDTARHEGIPPSTLP